MLQPTTPPPITTALAVLGRSMVLMLCTRPSDQGPICRRPGWAEQSAKSRDQLAVGRRESEFPETFWRDPFHRLRLLRLDRSRLEAAPIEVDHDRSLGVLPPDGLDPLADSEARRELLGELAPHRVLERLAGLALAARKLPHAREVRATSAPGDQIAARVVLDQRRHDLDEIRQAGRRRRSASWGRRHSGACAACTTSRRNPGALD